MLIHGKVIYPYDKRSLYKAPLVTASEKKPGKNWSFKITKM